MICVTLFFGLSKTSLKYKFMTNALEEKNKKFISTINTSLRESIKKRQTIRPNHIVITDFSFCEAAFEKKRKRCPLFMMNKSRSKRKINEGNVFTKQGIIASSPSVCNDPALSIDMKLQNRAKSNQNSPKKTVKKSSMVPYNFVKAKTSKHINVNPELCMNFPVFFLNNKRQRFLESASTERKPGKERYSHRRTYSQAKPMRKSQIKEYEGNNFGGWNTIDVQFDQFL